MRVCSGGSCEAKLFVRRIIQWLSSQLFAGNVKSPVKIAPACSSIVSPQLALFRASCSDCPAFTIVTLPGAGVLISAVFMYTRGNSAGPSYVEAADCGMRHRVNVNAKTAGQQRTEKRRPRTAKK